ncbi:hypothetical protein BGZ61DRAFT_583734 [Ilyonectria robusta]|uniref:uncharacterized protein n=1 Tax=Ilyonectria robusta TaxID=1079257 RepID=UPI001E8D2CFE|nr:uncharacterized protein BGZ61DRAFT_583734 [Ilyonectria robusta]KAH8735849.1 hypothetical protein BGZ61DRAFT_583734 [Ilyonectria robusta]
MLSHIAPTLLRRAVNLAVETASDSPSEPHSSPPQLPWWGWLIFLGDFIVLLPFLILTSYTLQKVLPVFAIIEDENPPAYEPVALDFEASRSVPGVPVPAGVTNPVNKTASAAIPTAPVAHDARPITSSFRATWRLLKSQGGFRAIFRGFGCYVFQGFVNVVLTGFLTPILGYYLSPIASLPASLLLVQYSTAWVHIVITPRSPINFWRRLPAFRSTFEATWRPVALFWFSNALASWAPFLFSLILNFKFPDYRNSPSVGFPEKSDSWKIVVASLASIGVQLFMVVPAYVTLVRVQASLLPDTLETIIPFDRTFQGKVEPAVVSGKGYVSLADAWSTFSKAAWRRLVILYVKIMAISMATTFLIFAVVGTQWSILAIKTGNSDKQ